MNEAPKPLNDQLKSLNTHFVGKSGVLLVAIGVLLPVAADLLPHSLAFVAHASDKLGDILIAIGTGGAYYGRPETIKS